MFKTPVYNIEGIPDAIKKLRTKMKRLENFRDPLRLIADDFFETQQGWMDSEGRGSWPPLNERYAKWKLKKVGNKPMLQFSGDMYDDLTGNSSGGVRVTPSRVTIRAPKSGPRWRWHTEGRSTGNKSGQARKRRQVISPAMRIRKARWAKMMRDWAAGESI